MNFFKLAIMKSFLPSQHLLCWQGQTIWPITGAISQAKYEPPQRPYLCSVTGTPGTILTEQHKDIFLAGRIGIGKMLFCNYAGRWLCLLPVAEYFQGIPPDCQLDQWMYILGFGHYKWCIHILTLHHSIETNQVDTPFSSMLYHYVYS